MVRKLFKYEVSAVWRSMLPMEIIVLGVALFTRLIQFFEVDSTVYDIVRTSAIVMLVISIIVSLVMSVVISIKRFYTNMFSSEGYLTMTLPATPTQHIFVKYSVAVLSVFGAILVSFLAGAVATMGEVFVEVCKAAGYLFGEYMDTFGGHGVAYIFEALFALLAWGSSTILLYYACISIGQTARKKRVLFAFVAYFAYYVFTQILGTVLLILVALQPQWLIDLVTSIEVFAIDHSYAFVHIMLWIIIGFYTVLSVALFFVSKYIVRNKLNLE